MSSETLTVDREPRRLQRAWMTASGRYLLNDGALLPALAVLYVVLTMASSHFFTLDNQLNILRQGSYVGIIALAMTFVLIAGEIDISVGSNVAFTSALLGVLVAKHDVPIVLGVVLVLVLGAAFGALTGSIRVFLNVPSFIITLSLYLCLRGAANLVTDAYPQNIPGSAFAELGGGSVLGLPNVGVVFIIVLGVSAFAARRTVFGRSVFAVGGNADAARISGIAVGRVRIVIFVLTGVAASLVGVLQSAYLSSGDPGLGVGLEFSVIAAVIIGGTSLAGGRGSLLGTLYGVVFVAALSNGLVLLGVNPYAQSIAQGVIVLLAVLLSSLRQQATESGNGRRRRANKAREAA